MNLVVVPGMQSIRHRGLQRWEEFVWDPPLCLGTVQASCKVGHTANILVELGALGECLQYRECQSRLVSSSDPVLFLC